MWPTDARLVLSSFRSCLARNEPFMNVPDTWLLCWFLVAAFKTYYNSTRFIAKSLPDRAMLFLFLVLTFFHFQYVEITPFKALLMTHHLALIAFQFLLGASSERNIKLVPVILVIGGNFYKLLRFIWDVYFVVSVVKELYEETSRARAAGRYRADFVVCLSICFLACYLYGKPGAAFMNNKDAICVGVGLLGTMGVLALSEEDPMRARLGCFIFALCVPWTHFI